MNIFPAKHCAGHEAKETVPTCFFRQVGELRRVYTSIQWPGPSHPCFLTYGQSHFRDLQPVAKSVQILSESQQLFSVPRGTAFTKSREKLTAPDSVVCRDHDQ